MKTQNRVKMIGSSEAIGIHKVTRPCYLTSGCTLAGKKRPFVTLIMVVLTNQK